MRFLLRALGVVLPMVIQLAIAAPLALVATPASAALGDFCFVSGTMPGSEDNAGQCTGPATVMQSDQCGTSGLFYDSTTGNCVANNATCSTGGGDGLYQTGSCQALPVPTTPTAPTSPPGFTLDSNAGAIPAGEQQPMCVNASPFIGGGMFVVSGTVLCYTGAGRNSGIYAYTDDGANSSGWNPFDSSTWDSLTMRDLYASDDISAQGTLSVFGGAQIYSLNGLNGVQVNDDGVLVRAADLDGNVASLEATAGNIVASATDGTSVSSLTIDGGKGISIYGQIGSGSSDRIGVVVSGDGQGNATAPTNGPAGWADVLVASKSYDGVAGSGVIVNDYGVSIKSASTGNSYNSFGQAGITGSMVTNAIGTGEGGGATTNLIGNSNSQSAFIANAGSSSMTVIHGALDFGTSGGTSTLIGATQQVSGGSSTVMGGSAARHVVMNDNGKMTVINGVAQEASTSMHITNGHGTTNGVMANEHTAAISGGTFNPTTMALTDSGAHFSDSHGDPVVISGVADGQGAFDAANIRQLDGGIASIAALAGIPSPTAGKNNSVGIGMGQHGSGMAMAVGGQSLVGDGLTIKYGASLSYSGGLFDSSTMLGVGMSW